MTDALNPPYGYPLRRNASTCLTTESDCGATWGAFRRCCPGKANCSDDGCCPTNGAGCQQRISEHPHCANASAYLYQAQGSGQSPATGYFCCVKGTVGFQRTDNSWVGCADSYNVLNSSFDLASLVVVPSSTASVSTTRTSAATASAMTSDSPSSSSSSSNTNTGAIAGGVVGGVVGAALILALLWFLIRQKKSATEAATLLPPPQSQSSVAGTEATYTFWDPQQRVQELQDSKQSGPVQELETRESLRPQELEGSTRPIHELAGS